MPSLPRSVKIGEDERGGWTSERPRRPGEAERPPRPADVSVRGRVLAPAEALRYAPGSLLVVVSPDPAAAEAFCGRVLAEPGALLAMGKVRELLAGRVGAGEVEAKAHALVDTAAGKRLAEGQTVVIALEGLDPEAREHYVRMAAAHGRPRHLILLEAAKDQVAEDDRAALAELRTTLDAGGLGQEGFVDVAAAGRPHRRRAAADRVRPPAARRLRPRRQPAAIAASARRPGMNRYSPPRVRTNGPCGARKNGGSPWIVILPGASPPIRKSRSWPRRNTLPSLSHWIWTRLELAREARQEAHEEQPAVGPVVLEHPVGQRRAVRHAAPDHPVAEAEQGGRRPSASRGFARRMCEPSGQRRPSGSAPRSGSR